MNMMWQNANAVNAGNGNNPNNTMFNTSILILLSFGYLYFRDFSCLKTPLHDFYSTL